MLITLVCADPLMAPIKPRNKQEYLTELYELQSTGPGDYISYQNSSKGLPCKKCRIIGAGQQSVVNLIAESQTELDLLRQWIQLTDKPRDSLTVTLYCIVVQDHQVERFLSSFLYDHSVFQFNTWREGLNSLLLEMERDFGVSLIASPRIRVEVGSSAKLKAQEEIRINTEDGLDGYLVDFAIVLKASGQGSSGVYRLDIDFQQHLNSRTADYGLIPAQMNSIQTQLVIKKGEFSFLGSAGQWSWVRDRGTFSILKILPEALIPFFHREHGGKSQLMIFVGCH